MFFIFGKKQGAFEDEVEDKAEICNIYAIGFDSATIGFRYSKQLKNN